MIVLFNELVRNIKSYIDNIDTIKADKFSVDTVEYNLEDIQSFNVKPNNYSSLTDKNNGFIFTDFKGDETRINIDYPDALTSDSLRIDGSTINVKDQATLSSIFHVNGLFDVKVDDVTITKSITEDEEGNIFVKDEGISTDKLANSSVTNSKLNDVAVSTSKIEDFAVTNIKIADDSIDTNKLSDNSVITDKILDYSVTEDKLDSNSVSTGKLADFSVTNDKLSYDSVSTDRIIDESVTVSKIKPSEVDGQVLKTVGSTVEWANDEFNPAVDDISIGYNDSDELEVKNDGISSIKILSGSVITDKLADGSVTTGKIEDYAVTTPKLANKNVTTGKIDDIAVTTDKINDSAVTTDKINDYNVTESKLATGSVTETKLGTGSVTNNKLGTKSVTPAKINGGNENQVLKTNAAGDVEWLAEQDISGKADKFLYTPDTGSETLYNLNNIQSFKIEGNGGGVDPDTGFTFTNFAGETTDIDIYSPPSFFRYQGAVATYERLPDLSDTSLENGFMYSVFGPIDFKGHVTTFSALPVNPADLDQYYVEDDGVFMYWSDVDDEWVANHCQSENGCDDSGYYLFGVPENPNWNRLDSELKIDQVLNIDSHSAIANRPVTLAVNMKVNSSDIDETFQYVLENIFPSLP
jgi:hypothetical protein